jgi:hypothetical protein
MLKNPILAAMLFLFAAVLLFLGPTAISYANSPISSTPGSLLHDSDYDDDDDDCDDCDDDD